MGEEVHQRTNRHVTFGAVKLKVFVGSHRCVVCVKFGFLCFELLECHCVCIGKWCVFVEETIVLPEHIKSSEREAAYATIVNSVPTWWLFLHGLLILDCAFQEFVNPSENEVHSLVRDNAFKRYWRVLISCNLVSILTRSILNPSS